MPVLPRDPRLRTAIVAVSWAGAVLALGALAFVGVRAGVSAAAGAALAVGNLWALARTIAALLPESRGAAEAQSRAAWALVALLKTVGLLAAAWLLMARAVVSPPAMLVGLLSLPIGIAIGSLVSDRSAASEDPP